jgi:hypothetical protein
MTKVYVVTEGSYSDYHIVAVFRDRKEAETFVGSNVDEIEEYELYEKQPVRQVVYYAKAESPDWNVEERSWVAWPWDSYYGLSRPVADEWPQQGLWPRRVTVHGSDMGEVRMALYDRIAKIKAEQEGIA